MQYPGGNSGQAGEQVTTEYYPQMTIKDVFSNTFSGYYYIPLTIYDAAGRSVSRQLGGDYQAQIPVVSNTYTYYPWTQQGGQLSNLRAGKLSTSTSNLQTLDYQYVTGGENVTKIVRVN